LVVVGVTGVVTVGLDLVRARRGGGAAGARPDYLLGLGQAGGRRLILVDIERLMSVRKPAAARQVA
jgi:purine-binding chemotaxis protein CheW